MDPTKRHRSRDWVKYHQELDERAQKVQAWVGYRLTMGLRAGENPPRLLATDRFHLRRSLRLERMRQAAGRHLFERAA